MGPIATLRNPLYLGLWFMVAALAFLMPPSGALFSIVLITFFIVRLTLGEEAFLAARLGEPYQDYLRAIPRFLPRLRGSIASSGARPRWLRALLTELTPIGIFVAFAFFSWSYNRRADVSRHPDQLRAVADGARSDAVDPLAACHYADPVVRRLPILPR